MSLQRQLTHQQRERKMTNGFSRRSGHHNCRHRCFFYFSSGKSKWTISFSFPFFQLQSEYDNFWLGFFTKKLPLLKQRRTSECDQVDDNAIKSRQAVVYTLEVRMTAAILCNNLLLPSPPPPRGAISALPNVLREKID